MSRTHQTMLLSIALVVPIIGLASAALQAEHSFDGSTFSPAGKLVGNILPDAHLTWERPDFTAAELELLEGAAAKDGLYSVRIRTDKGTLLTSVLAECLRLPGLAEQAELHATPDGALVGFNYDVRNCRTATKPGSSSSSARSESGADGNAGPEGRSDRLRVRVVMPTAGPRMALPELVGEFMEIPTETAELPGGFDPNAKPRAPVRAPAGQTGAQPPDDRTWLQKNWMFVLAGGMMVLNVIAKANAPPQGPPGAGPAAGAGAGGGGARRA